jgi:hypothetical protein
MATLANILPADGGVGPEPRARVKRVSVKRLEINSSEAVAIRDSL